RSRPPEISRTTRVDARPERCFSRSVGGRPLALRRYAAPLVLAAACALAVASAASARNPTQISARLTFLIQVVGPDERGRTRPVSNALVEANPGSAKYTNASGKAAVLAAEGLVAGDYLTIEVSHPDFHTQRVRVLADQSSFTRLIPL